MKIICRSLIGAACMLIGQNIWASNFSAQIFDLNADVQKDSPLYKVKHDETLTDEKLKFHNVYSYPDGKEAFTEDVELKGTEVISYRVNQKQLGDEGSIEVKDKKVIFTYKKKDHEAKTSEEDYVDNLAIGPSLVPYMQKNWDKIKAGEKIRVRLAVPDRRETVGFDLFKDNSAKPTAACLVTE